jgi:hypothetical protein
MVTLYTLVTIIFISLKEQTYMLVYIDNCTVSVAFLKKDATIKPRAVINMPRALSCQWPVNFFNAD